MITVKNTKYLLAFLLLSCIGTLIASTPAFAATSIKYGWIALDSNKNPVLAGSQYYLSSGKSQPIAWITNGVTVQKVTDKSVVYLNNTKTGTAQALVIGDKIINGYKDAFITTFTIVNKPSTTNNKSDTSSNQQTVVKTDLSKATVVVNKKGYYANGYDAVKPSFTIKVNGKVLKAGTDYDVIGYKNNKTPGKTATVTFKGKGNYKGTTKANFKLVYVGNELAKTGCRLSWSHATRQKLGKDWTKAAKNALKKLGMSTAKKKIYCSTGINLVVKTSGFDNSYKKINGAGSTGFYNYMKKSNKWKYIGKFNHNKSDSANKLMPGDIIVDPKHTHIAMYVSKGIAKNIVNNELKKIKSSWSGQSNNDAWISAHLTQHTGLCIGNRSYAMVNRSGFYIFRCVKPDETKYHIGQPVK